MHPFLDVCKVKGLFSGKSRFGRYMHSSLSMAERRLYFDLLASP